MARRRLLGDIVTVTPTGYDAWRRCRRLYLLGQLLGMPPGDGSPPATRGLLVHELLRLVHERGSVHDRAHVDDVLAAHGADDDVFRAMIERHAQRCPREYETEAHEVDLARFHRRPPPMFMATARLDALFVHDGVLDVRDYKTGARRHDRVADDPRARVQAWVLGREAQHRGLRLQLRYEHLAPEVDEDPEPWEPEADDLAAVDEELRTFAAALWAEERWAGEHDPGVCGPCRYRSLCVDSAAPGRPAWPILAGDPVGEDPGSDR